MSNFSRRGFLLLLPGAMTACATTPTNHPRLRPLVADKTIIVDATMLPLGIDYGTEGLMHAKHYDADFGAVWNPDAELADRLTVLFQESGTKAFAIGQWATPGMRNAWVEQARSRLRTTELGTAGWSRAFAACPTEKVDHLRGAGAKADLLVELFLARISSMDGVAAPARLACTAFVRVTDIATNVVTFTGKYWAFEDVKLNGMDIKSAIERDNLKVLKGFIDSVVQMAPLVHYSPLEGAFTQAFSTQMRQYW